MMSESYKMTVYTHQDALQAVEQNNVAILNEIIKSDSTHLFNRAEGEDLSLLMRAVHRVHALPNYNVIKTILPYSDVNYKDRNGETAFDHLFKPIFALYRNNEEINDFYIKTLHEILHLLYAQKERLSPDLDFRVNEAFNRACENLQSQSAIEWACHFFNLPFLLIFLRTKSKSELFTHDHQIIFAKINASSKKEIHTNRYLILNYLLTHGLLKELRALHERLPSIIMYDELAIELAMLTDDVDALHVMIDLVRTCTYFLNKGLYLAVTLRKTEFARMFIAAGADINCVINTNRIPIMMLVIQTRDIDLLRLFLQHDASILAKDGIPFQVDYSIESLNLIHYYQPNLFTVGEDSDSLTIPLNLLRYAAVLDDWAIITHILSLINIQLVDSDSMLRTSKQRRQAVRQHLIAETLPSACTNNTLISVLRPLLQALPDKIIADSPLAGALTNSIYIASRGNNAAALTIIFKKYGGSFSYAMLENSIMHAYKMNLVEVMNLLLSQLRYSTFISVALPPASHSILDDMTLHSNKRIFLPLFLKHAFMNSNPLVVLSILKTNIDLTIHKLTFDLIRPHEYKRLMMGIHRFLIEQEDFTPEHDVVIFNKNKESFKQLECELAKRLYPEIRATLSYVLAQPAAINLALIIGHPISNLIDHLIECYLSNDMNTHLCLNTDMMIRLKTMMDEAKQHEITLREIKVPIPTILPSEFFKWIQETNQANLTEKRYEEISASIAPMTYTQFGIMNHAYERMRKVLESKHQSVTQEGFLLQREFKIDQKYQKLLAEKRQALRNKCDWTNLFNRKHSLASVLVGDVKQLKNDESLTALSNLRAKK